MAILTSPVNPGEMELPLSIQQHRSIRESDGNVNIWEGAVRSGKTIASLFRWLFYVVNNHTQGELVVVSRTRASAARNVFATLADPQLFGPIAKHVKYTPGADQASILGRKMWVLGSSDSRSENVLRGLTCAGAYVDEVTLLRRDFFFQLLNRLWEGAQLFGTTNPDNPAHWLKVDFLDRLDGLPDWRSWKFVLDDNPVLSEERKERIRRENIGLFYRRNVMGEWVAAEGAIFPGWDPDRDVVPWAQVPRIERVLADGIDYGTTNPTAAVRLGIAADGTLYALDEYRIANRRELGVTLAEAASGIQAWREASDMEVPQFVPVDPSAADLRTELGRLGITTMGADNDVTYGVRILASLLAGGAKARLKVTDRCPGLIQELPGYSWDDEAAEKGEDKPLKVADHSIDALRYAVVSTETVWRPLAEHLARTATAS